MKIRTQKIFEFSTKLKVLMSAVVVAIGFSAANAPAFCQSDGGGYPYDLPRTYYVSKDGDNSDGRTWATAWNEMDQIHWSEISPQRHDSLVIDGGVGRMVYRKTMTVQTIPYPSPVTVKVSTEANHNGQAVIAPGTAANGIEISSGGFILNGSKRSGILIFGAKNGMTITTSAPYPFSVKNLEISNCSESGVTVNPAYYPIPLSQLILHDNATNLVTKQGSGPGGASLTKCWIYNSSYYKQADGIRCDGNASGPPMPGVTLNSCVLGPGLRDGISNLNSSRPSLTNCLLINSTRNNISSFSATLQNVTSFMTKLNPSETAHRCIKLQAGSPYYPIGSTVKKSIVYGGMVEIPLTYQLPYPGSLPQPFPLTVEQNTQFRTTGNTTALAPDMVNPQFRSPFIALLPNNTPVPLLMTLDFSLKDGSPAEGEGSEITSIKKLLGTFD